MPNNCTVSCSAAGTALQTGRSWFNTAEVQTLFVALKPLIPRFTRQARPRGRSGAGVPEAAGRHRAALRAAAGPCAGYRQHGVQGHQGARDERSQWERGTPC